MKRVRKATLDYLLAINAELIVLAEKAKLDTLAHLYQVAQAELESLNKSGGSEKAAA